MKINNIIDNYYKWLYQLSEIPSLTISSKIIIANSIDLLKQYRPNKLEFNDSLVLNKKLINQIDIAELSKLPKFHLFLYALHNKKGHINQFLTQWLDYIKEGEMKIKGFPDYLYNTATHKIDIKYDQISIETEKTKALKHFAQVSAITNFGQSNHYSQVKEPYLHLLKALSILFYRKNYDILSGNYILRSLIYLEGISCRSKTTDSYINYLKLQQNSNGYFGNYLKNEFSPSEITSILNISLNSCITLLEYEDPSFRIEKEIKENFNI